MASTYFGKAGRAFAWILYLFLFYTLSVAYVSGGGGLLQSWLGLDLPLCQVLFVTVLGTCVALGARMVDRLNIALMAGLILSYIAFVIFGLPHVHIAHLQTANWSGSLIALPVIFTAFSYQGIIPSLTAYLKRDARRVRIAIIAGTSVAFFIYLLWEFLILGIIPLEQLQEANNLGQTAVAPLKAVVGASMISSIGQAFAFFAIATSFLGVTLGLFDFLADGLQMPKRGMRKALLTLLTFLPPLVISLIDPRLFITALIFAGGIGCALLLGFLPTALAWASRYRHEGHGGPAQLRGGKGMLVALFIFVFLELMIEWRGIV
jgi:tyrosine-specific transport protein